MIAIDTSAMLALLLAEEEAREFGDVIREAGRVAVSAGTAVELAAVASRNDALFDAALAFLDEPYVSVEPVDAAQAAVAAQAYRRYGKGHHPAGLNLGDIFAYALARVHNLPLLFKGDDFSRTDIERATRWRMPSST